VNGADLVRPRLALLGGFTLSGDTGNIELPMSAQRLVALLALRERPLSRAYLAGVLWPEYSAERALADLRTALWRANHPSFQIIAAAGMRLCLRADVLVDVQILTATGRVAKAGGGELISRLDGMSWFELSQDLLPDWYDEWLVDERERLRQLRLHALERLTYDLSASGRHAEAIQAALAAVRLEPLRETAHAALIKAHLAEGNRSEALRQFCRCRNVLAAELAVEPSESIRKLVFGSAVLSGSI
jgi:DNA-binding SARP family transcriptional activator